MPGVPFSNQILTLCPHDPKTCCLENFQLSCAPIGDTFPQMKRIAKIRCFDRLARCILPGIGLILLTPFYPIFSQTRSAEIRAETGQPEIANFRPRDYQAAPVNAAIAQDSLGLVYVANDAGVLVFDGVQWQRIALPGSGPATSICSANGKIFVGGNNELGYLAPDERAKRALFPFANLSRIPCAISKASAKPSPSAKTYFSAAITGCSAGTDGKCASGCRKRCFTRRLPAAMRCFSASGKSG